ncbi:hypothetical protein WICPIJ_008599 [Wickerhamomyces pijperi]|uniref:Uncharacterized protein n=1 Tax=Wickerhamomyces pijperi TaxID=599730 RepID=A0A9P8PYB6_WICPI|nr:hypothetical protein WICPIJ_008599 [Wickerhamomyces pijperi]
MKYKQSSAIQLEPDIGTTVDQSGDSTIVPDLVHTQDGTGNTEAETNGGSNTDWVVGLVVPSGGIVSVEVTLLVDEVLGQGQRDVDGQVVTNQVHEVVHHVFEGVVGWDGNGQSQKVTSNGPHDSWNLSQWRPEGLGTEGNGVHVWNVVSNVLVVFGIDGVGFDTGDKSSTKNHTENQWEEQTDTDTEEDSPPWIVLSDVDSVISSVSGPAGSETENSTTETQDTRSSGGTRGELTGSEGTRDGESGNQHEENSNVWNPGPFFVKMHSLVTKHRDNNGNEGNNQDTGPWWQGVWLVHHVQQLGGGHGVNSTPTDTGNSGDEREDSNTEITN